MAISKQTQNQKMHEECIVVEQIAKPHFRNLNLSPYLTDKGSYQTPPLCTRIHAHTHAYLYVFTSSSLSCGVSQYITSVPICQVMTRTYTRIHTRTPVPLLHFLQPLFGRLHACLIYPDLPPTCDRCMSAAR